MPPRVDVLTRKPRIVAVIEGPQKAANGEKKQPARSVVAGGEKGNLFQAAKQQAETVLGIALQPAEGAQGTAKPAKNGSETVLADNLLHRPVTSGVKRGIDHQRMSITPTGDGPKAKVDD